MHIRYYRYVFGGPYRVHTQKTLQTCQLIRNSAHESRIENPKLLRTRWLRQHLASETVTSSVDQRLEKRISDFMSHKRQIHLDYYVITQKTDDTTKVSQLLEDFSSNKKTHRGLGSPSTSSQANTSEDNSGNKHKFICDELNSVEGVAKKTATSEYSGRIGKNELKLGLLEVLSERLPLACLCECEVTI
ncbi:hypothetical protein WA026_001927 [Henosepilachna vigintioctopunctata]|uniref:Uncharacterized protein n=1 Tax=Henosepilachna vigintioctopunctata TaxID=420089 RepID=A0AAW1UVX9_9CUCU